MSDDSLLKALRTVAADQARAPTADTRYEALARGELTEDAAEELKQESERSSDRWRAYQAHAPLSEAARDRLVGVITRPAPLEQAAPPGPGRTLDRRWPRAIRTGPAAKKAAQRWAFWGGAGTAIVAAAAVLVLVLRSPATPPLPAYDTSFEGGEQALRGEPDMSATTPKIPRGGRVSLALRPVRPVDGAVAARAFALRPGDARTLKSAPSLSEDGAARIAGRREDVLADLSPGTWELVLVVGRAASIPDAAALQKPSYAPPEDVRIARKTVILPAD